MGDRELLQWVSDKLHDVVGFSESSTAQFVVALARRASKSGKGAPALLAGLADLDVPANATSRAFAGELMARCVVCSERERARFCLCVPSRFLRTPTRWTHSPRVRDIV